MRNFNFKKYAYLHFPLLSSILSVVISILYSVKGLQTEFMVGTWCIIVANLAYVPLVLLFRTKFVPYFLAIYSVLLVFLTGFEKTFLFNNYTPLFVIFIASVFSPRHELHFLLLYFICAATAFVLNEESTILFLIHVARAFWFVLAFYCAVYMKQGSDDLVLSDDECKILDQLLDGKTYQKEVSGFSENTIYRKLKAARERNGCSTREELVERYRKSVKQKNQDHEC